ncbi:uncharacterized protein JN550_003942 [Neoarthrinium moseri]|uniref:uncharacterized protein n=1 Tax=Neoarthrinium moseri TaxID=1658444 RepID=UPI001FDBDC51|nr:uncharacterized protein JN550_003942 [Neoarthrinium moseri]KAI1872223.1 hypothetical protein JN550_003942 [Neoarthrinium moseri]
MGSKASKPVQSASRKFPTRAPGAVPPASRPTARPAQPPQQGPKASFAKDEAIQADGQDPDQATNPAFSQRLRQMGIATPNPTLSNSSIASTGPPASSSSPLGPSYPSPSRNPTLTALEARQRIQDEVQLQYENPAGGRGFVDIETLRKALVLRKRGIPTSDIEQRLRLKRGVVAHLESGGAVTPMSY